MNRLLTYTSALAFALTTSTSFAVENTSWGQLKQSLTEAPQVAAKKANNKSNKRVNKQTKTDDQVAGAFTNSGGQITVKHDNEGELEGDDFKVKFKVPKNAVPNNVRIDMAVTGSKASDLEVVFGPSGLVFDKTCTLEITLNPAAMDIPLAELLPYHIHGDGTPEQVDGLTVTFKDNGDIEISMSVDGFSRYGLRGGY